MHEELVIENKQDVLNAIKEMRKGYGVRIGDNFKLFEKEIDSVRFRLDRVDPSTINWNYIFKNLGCRMMDLTINENADKPLAHGFNRVALAELLVEKHTKYGPTALTKWGMLGILIRVDSKLQRAKNLQLTEEYLDKPNDSDESLLDTMNDMVGYCILAFILSSRNRV